MIQAHVDSMLTKDSIIMQTLRKIAAEQSESDLDFLLEMAETAEPTIRLAITDTNTIE